MSGSGAQGAASAAGSGVGGNGGGSTSSGSKVDAIWQQLKGAHAAPKAQAVNFNKLWHGFSSDPMQGTKRPAAKPPQPPSTYESQLVQRSSRGPADAHPSQQQQQQQPAAVRSKPDPETALQLVARCVAGLKDSSQSARRKALQDVQSHLLDNPSLDESWLASRLEGDGLGKALLRRFDDPADSCREAAVSSLLRLLSAAPGAVLALLPYAFPVLAERVRHREEGSKNLTEPCEEVRLALARLLRSLVVLGGKGFAGYAGEAVELVGALAEDPFHEVQEEACGVVGAMNEVLGMRLQPVAKQLVAALLPLTTAKRHRVRVAALQALRPTMHQGAHEMILEMVAWRDPNVIPIKAFYGDDLKVNFCGKLAADPHPAVRREFLAVLADWMTGLRERLDHEARLLPYVLSALNDESPEIQSDAVSLLERLGAQYESDHEKELKDTLAYLPAEAHGIGWQAAGAAGYVYGSAAAGEETVNGGRAVFVLPGPLRCRPRLGTRRLVQTNFSRIIGALSEEVTSWLLEARRRAAALLRTQLLLVEEWSEQHLHLIMPALCKAISDPEVRPVIRDCCSLLGAFTDPEVALQLLATRGSDEAADAAQRAAALEVLGCVIRGAGPRRALDAHLPSVLQLLSGESLLTSEDSRIRRSLQEVVQQLLATCGPACGRHAAQLLWVCLHLRSPGRAAPNGSSSSGLMQPAAAAAAAFTATSAPTAAAATASLEGSVAGGDAAGGVVEGCLLPRLAEVCGCSGGPDELLEAHRRELLGQSDPGASPNVLLATGVACRLMLPYSAQSHLLYLPEEALGRVLPAPPAVPTPSPAPTSQADARAEADDEAGGDGSMASAPMDVDTTAAASQQQPQQPQQYWQASSTVAVLSHLRGQLGWLPRQSRCATLFFTCLEACLATVPPPQQQQQQAQHQQQAPSGTSGTFSQQDVELPDADTTSASAAAGTSATSEVGELLEAVLSQALAACQELPPPALLAALRCMHAAVRRGLLPGAVLVVHLEE
ncbi:hypothetical protein Agub_g2068, partial [Astrephomene gubernaculifera]